MILEAAKSIAAATSALVKAASAAQRELIDLGKVRKHLKKLYNRIVRRKQNLKNLHQLFIK